MESEERKVGESKEEKMDFYWANINIHNFVSYMDNIKVFFYNTIHISEIRNINNEILNRAKVQL